MLYGQGKLRDLWKNKFPDKYKKMIEHGPVDDLEIAEWAATYIMKLERELVIATIKYGYRPEGGGYE